MLEIDCPGVKTGLSLCFDNILETPLVAKRLICIMKVIDTKRS